MAKVSSLTLISDEKAQGIHEYLKSSDEAIQKIAHLSQINHNLGLSHWTGNFPYDDMSTKLLKKRPPVLLVTHISCAFLSKETMEMAEIPQDVTNTQWYSVWVTIMNFGLVPLKVTASLGNKKFGWASENDTVISDPGVPSTFHFLVPSDYLGSVYFICGMANALTRFNLDFVIGYLGKIRETD